MTHLTGQPQFVRAVGLILGQVAVVQVRPEVAQVVGREVVQGGPELLPAGPEVEQEELAEGRHLELGGRDPVLGGQDLVPDGPDPVLDHQEADLVVLPGVGPEGLKMFHVSCSILFLFCKE